MKEAPDNQKLEELLRSSVLVAGGFMGSDVRSFSEIIDADSAAVEKLGLTTEQLVERMQEITGMATSELGAWVKIDKSLDARVHEVRGSLPCPWSHPGRFAKRITHLRFTDTDRRLKWSDLNIHLIGRHGFFQGKGSAFRIEPQELSVIVF